jgi:23S rRNA pseudouridine955/2504/2580 synthase/23S rRNA pseudouridine1911/1915/1917 synthase
MTEGAPSYTVHFVTRDALNILLNDADLVAVEKPAGLATIPGRGETDSLLERIAAQLNLPHKGEADPRIRVVHRLDKDTSGVMLFAKNIETQRHLSHQFQNNQVEKEYLALVVGHPDADEGEIDGAIGPHPNAKTRMAVLKHGRPALTRWKLEKRFRTMSLLRVFPETGKTHQIRVHLKHIGLPLAIDALYNPPRKPGEPIGIFLSQFKRDYRASGDTERPLIARLTLHAEQITFDHPKSGKTTVTCPPPKDLRAVLNQLDRFARR